MIDVNISHAQEVIKKLNPTFDTHDFIEQLSKDFERKYVDVICERRKDVHIFMSAHAAIGWFLSNEAKKLKIEKQSDRLSSRNIKGYKSPNQKWRKL